MDINIYDKKYYKYKKKYLNLLNQIGKGDSNNNILYNNIIYLITQITVLININLEDINKLGSLMTIFSINPLSKIISDLQKNKNNDINHLIKSQLQFLSNTLQITIPEINSNKLTELDTLVTLDSNLFILLHIVFNNIADRSFAKIKLIIYYLTVTKFDINNYNKLVSDDQLDINIDNNIDFDILKKDKIVLLEYLLQISEKSINFINKIFDKLKLSDLSDLSDDNDKKIILKFLSINPNLLKKVNEKLKIMENMEIFTTAIYLNPFVLEYVPESLKNESLIRLAVSTNGSTLQSVPSYMITPRLSNIAVKQNGLYIKHVPENLKTMDLVDIAINNNGLAIQYVPESFKDNEELVKKAINNNGLALQYVPERFKNNIDLVRMAINNNGEAIHYVQKQMKEQLTKEDYYNIVTKYGLALEYIPENKIDMKIVVEAINNNPFALGSVPEKLIGSINIKTVTFAITEEPTTLINVPETLKDQINIEDYKKVVNKDGLALQNVPEKIKHNTDIVKLAVKNNGLALQYVPMQLKTTYIVKMAVQNNGLALIYVPEDKMTEDIILLALKYNPITLEFVPTQFKEYYRQKISNKEI